MAGYTKLFSSIVTSTVWCEDAPTRVVWVAMLAMKDRDGVVEGSIPGFARVANVTVEQMTRAVEVLSGPDPHSRTPDNEGRRIEAVPGGWRVLNHEAYRALESVEHRRERDAERQRRHRAMSRDVTKSHGASPHTDADTEAEAVHLPPASPKSGEAPPVPAESLGSIPPGSTPRPRRGGDLGGMGGASDQGHPETQERPIPAVSKRFTKPTPQEVEAYAAEIGYTRPGLGASFCDFYGAKGWVVGKSPMRDWRAAVRTWKQRDAQGGPNGTGPKSGAAPIPGKYASAGL